MFDEKAQVHTLEGVAAATIMLMVIIYAIDTTSMTPLTSSTANTHIETELQTMGKDILDILDYAEPGYKSKLYYDIAGWNGREYIWSGSKYMDRENYSYPQNNLTNNMTQIFSQVLVSRAIAHNVEFTYLLVSENTILPMDSAYIYNGNPSDNAVIISKKIVLNDDFNRTKNPNNPIQDIDKYTNFDNIVDVKIVLWRS